MAPPRKHQAPQTASVVTGRRDREALRVLIRDGRVGGSDKWTQSDALRSAIHIAAAHRSDGQNRLVASIQEENRDLRAQLAYLRRKANRQEEAAKVAEQRRLQAERAIARLEWQLPVVRNHIKRGHQGPPVDIDLMNLWLRCDRSYPRVEKRILEAVAALQPNDHDPGGGT